MWITGVVFCGVPYSLMLLRGEDRLFIPHVRRGLCSLNHAHNGIPYALGRTLDTNGVGGSTTGTRGRSQAVMKSDLSETKARTRDQGRSGGARRRPAAPSADHPPRLCWTRRQLVLATGLSYRAITNLDRDHFTCPHKLDLTGPTTKCSDQFGPFGIALAKRKDLFPA